MSVRAVLPRVISRSRIKPVVAAAALSVASFAGCGLISGKIAHRGADAGVGGSAGSGAFAGGGTGGVGGGGTAGTGGVAGQGGGGGPVCTPGTITETDFVTGTLSDLELTTLPGTLMLERSWTVMWHASEGILPNADTPSWTWEAPSGGITALATDPATGEPAVHMDSTGVDDLLRYVRNGLGLSNNTGSAFQIRARIVQASGTDGFGCAVELWDGTRKLRFGMDESRILETYTAEDHVMDTTAASHTYRLGLQFGDFSVYADEVFAFDQGSGTIGFDSPNQIMWGDQSGSGSGINCEMYVNHFYYYTSGSVVPFTSPGTYESEVYDLSTSNNNLDSGASITSTAVTPASTSIVFETRSGDTSTPDGGWSGWSPLSNDLIQSPASRYLQVRAVLSTGDPSLSAALEDYLVSYCTYL